ncbi:RING-H2 finger protein ATL44 [Platanthera guangdongensis]|uniref:RING-H2 finger protein ATL44 n=1 Tax=Platanthera guangdongensis TaxID=2320717 RepID=A0ABR2LS05_9ASPA
MFPHRKYLRDSPPAEAVPPSGWAPFGSAGDFGKNMGIAFSALLIAFALAFGVGALIHRRLLWCRRRSSVTEKPTATEAAEKPPETIPSIVFSAGDGLPKRGGACPAAAAECAICLAEFADGDIVRVLPNCGHGFHVGCIDAWIVSRRSCPTCRESCLPSKERLGTEGV